ncbi:tRNA(m5U54)methyltransferase [Coemansia sp. RSA 2706]|nr:tRNA(m5U54)methyltransferase [Coemansia sp. RSA 2711]KAJ1844103.1 tRNA(m5U54)methyltransferase [Coemansia sp. RSA 2708]KAJ2306809.1 tRNA(m5U54)methyltransferase [Coemansia sp. RSA 2706]
MPENTVDTGTKRAVSPPSADSRSAGSGPEQKRTKSQHNRLAKKRRVRKTDADGTVLEAIELLLRDTWLGSQDGADCLDAPAAFGWSAGDQQAEAAFCREPPVPAKLAGADESECELDVYVHEVTERGVGIATREAPEQLRELVMQGLRPWVFTVPFTLKGERARIRSVRHEWGYTQADLIGVTDKSLLRIEAPCKYFGQCSGCQLQHVEYKDQLEFKRQVVERAFAHANPRFGKLPVLPVSQSPLPYGYRTKLTPHFDIRKNVQPKDVAIGFNIVGQRRVLDIEDCIIGTETVRRGFGQARKAAQDKMSSYKRGATLLVRETNIPKDTLADTVVDVPVAELVKDYTLDPKSWVTDVVDDLKFRYPASSFFQNNASILPAFTGYVREELQKWSRELNTGSDGAGALRTLIDAYCGSGLFAIACHRFFEKVVGIEISNESISCAGDNAKMNGADNIEFILGDAARIFEKVSSDPSGTAVIIDPPRKGSNPDFLDQLVAYGPRVIVYIACGVPAQARDLNHMYNRGAIAIDGQVASGDAKPSAVYRIAAIQPFDLFPQTYHVENIVTLVRED